GRRYSCAADLERIRSLAAPRQALFDRGRNSDRLGFHPRSHPWRHAFGPGAGRSDAGGAWPVVHDGDRQLYRRWNLFEERQLQLAPPWAAYAAPLQRTADSGPGRPNPQAFLPAGISAWHDE